MDGGGRLVFFELEPTKGRPALKKYFDRLKARPSYASADIGIARKAARWRGCLLTKMGRDSGDDGEWRYDPVARNPHTVRSAAGVVPPLTLDEVVADRRNKRPLSSLAQLAK